MDAGAVLRALEQIVPRAMLDLASARSWSSKKGGGKEEGCYGSMMLGRADEKGEMMEIAKGSDAEKLLYEPQDRSGAIVR